MGEITLKTSDVGRLVRLPGVLERIPISRSTWWDGVRAGKYPKPVKLGSRLTCWRLADIIELAERGIQ